MKNQALFELSVKFFITLGARFFFDEFTIKVPGTKIVEFINSTYR